MNINKKIKLLDFKLTKALWWGLFWAYKSSFHGTWMEFAEHREYVFWDSIKNIDWKTSAKTTTLHIKKYEEERDLNVLFLLDGSESMSFWIQDKTKKDLQEELFYSLSFSALQNNDNIGAFIFGWDKNKYIPYKKSKWNIFKILEELDKYSHNINSKKDQKNKTENVLKLINKQNIKNNLIFILTDDTSFYDDSILRIIWNKNEVILINIFDYFENNLSSYSNYLSKWDWIKWNISFNFLKWFLNIKLWDKKQIEEYRELRKSKISDLKRKMRKNKIGYLKVDTKNDLYKKLIWYFSKISNW